MQGSRSQQLGVVVVGELRNHLREAWKAFFRTWHGRSGAAGPGRGAAGPPALPVPLYSCPWSGVNNGHRCREKSRWASFVSSKIIWKWQNWCPGI